MFSKIIKRYRRIIIAVAGVLLVGGVAIGVVVSNKGDEAPKKEGVSISAGDDNKDNQADFNGQEGQQTTTQPVIESPTNDIYDTIIEQKGSILGEWTTSKGDTFNCLTSSEGEMYATLSLSDSGSFWSGTVETDNSSYINITDGNSGAVVNIGITQMATASELGLDDNQVYMLLKFSGEATDRLFRRANEDYVHEDVKDVIDDAGNGISGGSPDDDHYIPDDVGNQIVDIEDDAESEENIESE